jgi:dihydrofolate reductase
VISAIVAMARNYVIGKDNQLLWHLPNDLKRFRQITDGHTLIMGRKTFESLPKILPNRHHVVITKNPNYTVDSDQVTIVHSIGELRSLLDYKKDYFVIGGGMIYQTLLPLCEKLYITQIQKDFQGDTLFPMLNLEEWEMIENIEGIVDENNPLPHQFITLKRKTT